jgi:hypothetical protein
MELKDEKLSIEEVQKVTSKLSCDYNMAIEERVKLEEQLNAMFGQWREAD